MKSWERLAINELNFYKLKIARFKQLRYKTGAWLSLSPKEQDIAIKKNELYKELKDLTNKQLIIYREKIK